MQSSAFFGSIPRATVRQVRRGLLELTPTEAKVLGYVLRGFTAPQIAAELGKSERTVDTQVLGILAKCECPRALLIRICCRELADDAELFAELAERAANPRQPAKRP